MAAHGSGFRWYHYLLILLAVGGIGAGGWFAFAQNRSASPANPKGSTTGQPQSQAAVAVDVIHPKPGGIQRTCVQPGTVEPFESADIYAKVSGYLVEQTVDIGSPVKAGEVIARIAVPEYDKQVQRDKALKKDNEAKVRQMDAALASAKAEARAADAAVVLARVTVRAKTAFRMYREKQLARIKELAAQNAIDERLRDEQEDYYMSSLEAENSAKEGVNSSQERANAAHAKIKQSEADLEEAKAQVDVAQAELEKSQVLTSYTIITSPYNGIVTKRNFLPGQDGRRGDFIKAADQGGTTPMLAVERTDKMRVVVQVPDRDVPYVHEGAPAIVQIDALPGVVYQTKGDQTVGVSRWAKAEDPATRTMRTEIDVMNTDGKLAHGMYGRVTIILTEGAPHAVRIPSSALAGKAAGGKGTVRIVRDGKVHIVPIQYASDNGVEAEIVAGLTPADPVIVHSATPVEEGTPVTTGAAPSSH